MQLKSITEAGDLKGKRVLVRASFNVPLVDGAVRNSFRLTRALPTLNYLQNAGAKVVIISHIGRDPKDTLEPVFEELTKSLKMIWGGMVTDEAFTEKASALGEGELLLAENLRQDPREEENDPTLVATLASLGEIYVNDSFAEAHRKHASTYGVAEKLPSYAGLTLIEEVSELSKAMKPQSPSLFLLGGAKFETKLPLIEKYLAIYDKVFVGGALAHDILVARGLSVGKSLVSPISLKDAPFLYSEKLIVPVDVLVEDSEQAVVNRSVEHIRDTDIIYDLGEKSIALLKEEINKAQTILWNGPFGNYEAGYKRGTEEIAKAVAGSSAFSVIGGGDTVAAVENLNLNDQFGFISIGGGSMLTLLEHGTTEVLERLV